VAGRWSQPEIEAGSEEQQDGDSGGTSACVAAASGMRRCRPQVGCRRPSGYRWSGGGDRVGVDLRQGCATSTAKSPVGCVAGAAVPTRDICWNICWPALLARRWRLPQVDGRPRRHGRGGHRRSGRELAARSRRRRRCGLGCRRSFHLGRRGHRRRDGGRGRSVRRRRRRRRLDGRAARREIESLACPFEEGTAAAEDLRARHVKPAALAYVFEPAAGT